jgi:hypothetical protein
MLGLGDDAAMAAPAVQRTPGEVGEATRGTALGQALQLGRGQVVGDRADQSVVAGKAEHVVHAVGLTPSHQLFAGKA